MSLSIGIVGLPNVGKSTLFTALTKKQAEIANYPFTTIDPNVGVVPVPDPRVTHLAQLSHSQKTIYTTVNFVDIAGLVKDAHKGEGLGNKFLSHIREVDAIAEVVRFFTDPDITHVADSIDPARDAEIINLELVLADLATVTEQLAKKEKPATMGDKELAFEVAILQKIKHTLEAGKLANTLPFDPLEEWPFVKSLNLLTIKPILYIANVDEDAVTKSFTFPYQPLITISAKIEAELAGLSDTEAKEYLKSLDLATSGLEKLIQTAYETLGLITFLTTGEDETRAWTIRRGTRAPQAAGVIHSDFEKGFIRAETISYDDFIKAGSEVRAKELGLMRTEGKEYIVRDGDIMHFRFN
ncbi:MAG: redox-regulated ATPase YchF [Parcubacteria group bacterium]|nr:redox-regulated ATPase YchF [Parcubacteria group bacterium]